VSLSHFDLAFSIFPVIYLSIFFSNFGVGVMVLTGLLLSLRKGDFVDKQTGEHIQFCHLKLAQQSDSEDIIGLDDQKVKVPFEAFEKFRKEVTPLIGRQVEVDVDLKIRGKFVHIVAAAVRPVSQPMRAAA